MCGSNYLWITTFTELHFIFWCIIINETMFDMWNNFFSIFIVVLTMKFYFLHSHRCHCSWSILCRDFKGTIFLKKALTSDWNSFILQVGIYGSISVFYDNYVIVTVTWKIMKHLSSFWEACSWYQGFENPKKLKHGTMENLNAVITFHLTLNIILFIIGFVLTKTFTLILVL